MQRYQSFSLIISQLKSLKEFVLSDGIVPVLSLADLVDNAQALQVLRLE